ncbi:MAG: two-component regulator propeller domain-containing protein [Chthoniobacterales bacterium]
MLSRSSTAEMGFFDTNRCGAVRHLLVASAILLSCCGLLAVPAGQAASPKLVADYVIRSWRTDEGLPQNSVRTIAKDHRGYIWCGTEEGLVRFDGARFSVFDRSDGLAAKSDFVSAVVAKGNGDGLWVGTDGGGVWESTMERLRAVAAPPLLPSGLVSALCEDRNGALWIGTREGLSRLENGAVQTWRVAEGLAHDYVRSVFQDASGRIWIGTYAGLNYVEEGSLKPAPWPELAKAHVRAISQTSAGHLFFGTNGDGLFALENNHLRHYSASDGLGHDVIGGLATAADGALWIATYGGGVTRLKDNQFASIVPEDGLSNNLCLSVYVDPQGLVWIGHNGGGLTCLLPRRVRMIDQQSGLAGEIALPILQTKDGAVWVGTATAGVTRFHNGKATIFNTTNGLPRNVILALGEDEQGAVWIATAGGAGVTRYSGGTFRNFTPADGLSDKTVTAILADRRGRVWLGTEAGGISIYDGERFTSLRRSDGLISDGIVCLFEAGGGDIWIGTRGGGINRFRNGKLETVLTDDSVGNIYTLEEDAAGYVWAGTATGGLLRISDSGQVARVPSFGGPQENQVFGMAADGEGYFWFSSTHGISRVSREQLMDVCDGRASRVEPLRLDKSDGMAVAECNGGVSPSAARLTNGEIWFPTMRGVAVIVPGSVKNNEPSLPPIIEKFSVDEQLLPHGAPVRLAASSRHFEFACTVPAFRAPQRVRFRYRLDGFDEDWSAPTERRTAHYTRLPAGEYTFRVTSSGENGVWNPSEAAIRFSVVPPFYKTKLFYALLACAAAGMVLAVHHFRVSRLRRYNAQLAERVEARTGELARANAQLQVAKEQADHANAAKSEFLSRMSHELRTPLNAILGFGQLLELDDLTSQQHASVQHILNGGRHLLGLINEVLDLARIETGRLDLEIEPVRIRELITDTIALVQPLAAERSLELVEPVGEELDVTVLADRQRLKQVLLNLLSNAIKYNREHGSVHVSCEVREQRFDLTVADTGRGMSAEDLSHLFVPFERFGADKGRTEGTGLGLCLCKRLIESMDGRIEVESAIGRGSSFSISLPLVTKAINVAAPFGEEDPAAQRPEVDFSTMADR